MEITKRNLKKIIKEEMESLSRDGDFFAITEVEKEVFNIILEKMTTEQLKSMGLRKI